MKRRLLTSALLLLALGRVPTARAMEPEQTLRVCATLLMASGAGFVLLSLAAAKLDAKSKAKARKEEQRHRERAAAQGKQHLGYSVYFHYSTIEALLSDGEKRLANDAKADPIAVVKMFSAKLYGDYDQDKMFEDYEDGIDASQFFVGQATKRGVCRHKAVVLAAILNHLGVKAETKINSNHMYVVLPDLDLASDPTADVLMDTKTYEKDVWRFEHEFLFSGAI